MLEVFFYVACTGLGCCIVEMLFSSSVSSWWIGACFLVGAVAISMLESSREHAKG